jgi:integrase
VDAVLATVPGSAGTRHRVLATLRGALNAAIKARKITWNPCTGIELEPENPPEAQRWTPEQAARFIEATADDRMGLMFRVMVLSGCRRSELAGFRWSWADLEVPYRDPESGQERLGAVLTVRRIILQFGGQLHEETTAKSRAGDRLVFLDADTADLLREHRKTQMKARLAAPPDAWEDHDLVFCREDGTPWSPDLVSKRFRKLAVRAGLPPVKLHEGGRHTGNSLMYDAEVRQDIVMRQVGHASAEISQRYNHPLKQAHLAAAGQVAALVRKAGSGS